MIRTLLATTAIATLLSSGAFAQTTPPAATDPAATPMTDTTTDTAPADAAETPGPEPIEGHLASNIIGENVYNGVADDAENIGTVNDIVLDANGQASLIVVGVGGFLGLGEKDVALEYATLEWAQREDGTTWLVAAATREELEQQEEFDRGMYDPDDAEGMAATGAATGAGVAAGTAATMDSAADATEDAADATADAAEDAADAAEDTAAAAEDTAEDAGDAMTDDTAADDDAAAAPAPATTDTTAAAPAADATDTDATAMAVDRTTLTEVDAAGMSADDLIGTSVYGADDENVGSIEDVILDGDAVDFVTLEVGGFLGMGDKEVAVSMENLAFMTDEDGEVYLYTSFTEEQLEAQPEYDEATFADARDEQLLINPAN